MEVLFIVLNHEQHFDEVLREFSAEGIHGGTILESQGLAATLAEHSEVGYDFFRNLLNGGRPYNKTIFLILSEEDVKKAKECVRRVVGNIEKENVGIMFSIDVKSFEGLTK
ncbi:MAG: hypothetical protein SPI61_04830 [Ezakiella sp.]|uniref:hypothetical protein n=1 Tax=Ezakiella sp. TaxID=1935205 RepID=UPI002973C9F5|nr:hypothetical protein [Ezakiella sp.]MDD7731654.1 hypothetical protein [Eubacteriales bacterium]MDY6080027.1 hypothetical protein [Ezakiella sp.]